MIKGPCRGKECDFWARVKIRKYSMDEQIKFIRDYVTHDKNNGSAIRDILDSYWKDLGVKNMQLLCSEEPDLCEKIRSIEAEFL